jgi:hypothetical protein
MNGGNDPRKIERHRNGVNERRVLRTSFEGVNVGYVGGRRLRLKNWGSGLSALLCEQGNAGRVIILRM